MITVLLWYLSLVGLGLLALPLAFRFLGKLPDRGYTFIRPLGLLLWSFLFWILGSYGLLQNNTGSLLTALLFLGGLSIWAWRGLDKKEIRAWFKSNRGYVLGVEALFLIAFLAMAFLRASNPDLGTTEKPMELGFINAILRSPVMPPHDPWLSGYSISYYYFGFLMVAMLAKITTATGGAAFSLGIAMTFAMAALGAYGLAYNLLALRAPNARRSNAWLALLAPLLTLVLGNVEGLLEILHARHMFWSFDSSGGLVSDFWAWLDVKDLAFAPTTAPAWQPRLYGTENWWWWRASRVINDLSFSGGQLEVIDEIPAFSFVLGDLHPHVLSMPFVYLAAALAFQLYQGGATRSDAAGWLGLRIQSHFLVLSAVILGGLAFINIWDFPIYLVLFAGAYAIFQAEQYGWGMQRISEFLTLLLLLGVGGLLLYLPFYLGFSSQAGGVLPNVLNPTRGAHLWIMFGTLLLPIVAYLIGTWNAHWQPSRLLRGFFLALALIIGLWVLSLFLPWMYATLFADSNLTADALTRLGAPDLASLLGESIRRRIANPGGWLSLLVLLGMLFGLFWPNGAQPKTEKKKSRERAAGRFHLILALFAALLVLAPEFIYLRDQFGTRMNTVFKFYMQAWLIWGVVAAVALSIMIREWRGLSRWIAGVIAIFLLAAGLIYPAFAFPDRYRRANDQALELDGAQRLAANDLAAINWLRAQPLAPLVEAVGGSYTGAGRMSVHSGQTAVLGWPGHEGQWRGDSVDFAPRIAEIETLYTTNEWLVAQAILEKYDVRYIVIGFLERNTYGLDEGKFQENLEVGFQNDSITIYLAP